MDFLIHHDVFLQMCIRDRNYSYQYQSLYNEDWNILDYNWSGSSALMFTLSIPSVSYTHLLPVFLYEKSASAPHRENLAAVRKGEFEGMAEKRKQPEWHPDFGLAERHPTAGTVAIGARMPLVA